MVSKVFPLSWIFSPLTFSRKKAFGRFLLMISATSKNKVPLVSSKPLRLPAKENAWQGNPAHRTSKSSGMYDLVSSLVISPNGTSPKFAK